MATKILIFPFFLIVYVLNSQFFCFLANYSALKMPSKVWFRIGLCISENPPTSEQKRIDTSLLRQSNITLFSSELHHVTDQYWVFSKIIIAQPTSFLFDSTYVTKVYFFRSNRNKKRLRDYFIILPRLFQGYLRFEKSKASLPTPILKLHLPSVLILTLLFFSGCFNSSKFVCFQLTSGNHGHLNVRRHVNIRPMSVAQDIMC